MRKIGKKAVPALLFVLENGSDTEQKIHAVRILSDMNAIEAVPEFAKMAQDKDKTVQVAAIEALGKCADESALGLLRRLSLSFNKTVRKSARAALDKVNERIGPKK